MRYLTALLVLLLYSCSSPVEPLLSPPGAVPLDPPPEYRVWYAEMEKCAGLDGDFNRVRWFVVPGPYWYSDDVKVGAVYRSSGAIYVAEGRMMHRASVTHEILHELLYSDHGETGHPRPPFGTCAPLTL